MNAVDPMGLSLIHCEIITVKDTRTGLIRSVEKKCRVIGPGWGYTGSSSGIRTGTLDGATQVAGPWPSLPFMRLVHLMTPLVPEIDASLCDLAAGVSNTIETGQQSASAAVNDFLSTVPSSLYPTPGASTGYSLDASFVAAYIGGVAGSVGIWGDNGNYGYTLTAGVVAGIGVSASLGGAGSVNYSDVTHGARVFLGGSVPISVVSPGFEFGGGTQFSNFEANIGVGTGSIYTGVQYVFQRTCS